MKEADEIYWAVYCLILDRQTGPVSFQKACSIRLMDGSSTSADDPQVCNHTSLGEKEPCGVGREDWKMGRESAGKLHHNVSWHMYFLLVF